MIRSRISSAVSRTRIFLSGSKGDHCIGIHFDVLDQIGVDDDRQLIEARQTDHKYLFGNVGGRKYVSEAVRQTKPGESAILPEECVKDKGRRSTARGGINASGYLHRSKGTGCTPANKGGTPGYQRGFGYVVKPSLNTSCASERSTLPPAAVSVRARQSRR